MNNARLKCPDEAANDLARVLEHGGGRAVLEVRDDKCFRPDEWLRVGDVTVHPSTGMEVETARHAFVQAIQFGAYSWRLPPFDTLLQECLKRFHEQKWSPAQRATNTDKTRRALETVVHCAVRCGFVHPTFDAGCVGHMPLTRPTTVVVDTSAILQGGLDFVVRFLYPMARIKIPAIAHMEVLNMADRYLKHRRCDESKINVASALFDHVTSQSAQRVLLRLELQTETEIERPRLGADPLRGIVQPDSDAEDKALGLQMVQRSFADRLILETAIHHRDRLSPDHPIAVLTADQGLARMSLAEGVPVFFFCTPLVRDICGVTLTATCFRPFTIDFLESPLFYIPLPTVVWELGCTFGSVRLITDDRSCSVVIAAIGEDLPWNPFHSRDDLLWLSVDVADEPEGDAFGQTVRGDQFNEASTADACVIESAEETTEKAKSESNRSLRRGTLTGAYRFSVESMVNLVMSFDRRTKLHDQDGMQLVGLSTVKRYADLRNFLLAGEFVERDEKGLKKLPPIDELIDAMKVLDACKMNGLFLRVPSYNDFIAELIISMPTPAQDVKSIAKSAVPTYTSLAEMSCAALHIAGEGIVPTPTSPVPREFVRFALECYGRLRNGEPYVLTGKWLEELAKTHGIHPVIARQRLNEAREAGLIKRYTEGSTPETQYERHQMTILERQQGVPAVRTLNLYHGDFLIPGKASVSIRLDEASQ